METKFNFNSQICTTREQSERLLSLGLKKETADMGIYYSELYGVDRVFPNDVFDEKPTFDSDEIPAWSLHRLIEIVPSTINKMLWFTITPYTALYDSVDYSKSFDSKDNLYDNIIDCIEWLIKEGYFNKEYLED